MLPDLFAGLNARAPHSVAGWRAGAPVTLAAVHERMAAWYALALRTAGRNVALYLDDSVEFGAALLGAWQAGKTVWLSADTLDASCAALAPSVDAYFGQFPARWQPLVPHAGEPGTLTWRALDPDFSALVVHTSGSSGQAQAIPKRLSQLAAEVATLEHLFGDAVGAADVVATVSHQHIYGLLFKVLWPLVAGRAIHANSVSYPEQLAQLLGQRACVLVASPAHLKRLPEHLDWRAAALGLRAVFSSGGPLTPEAAAAAGRLLGQTPIEIYGSSETGGIATRQRVGGGLGEWQPMPGVSWRVGQGEANLEVRSAHLAGDGWLCLPDRVQAAGERFLLLGRSDRLVKIEEKRISLDALEQALLASGLAAEARVLLCPERSAQRQALAAIVVPSAAGRAVLDAEGKAVLNRRLREHLAGVVEAVGLPRRWRYPEQLPVDAQGKVTQARLLALLDADTAADPAAARTTAPERLPRATLREHSAQRVLIELTVPSTLLYLDGHFASLPVLPGVVQVDWAILYARRYFALAPSFRAIHALKFQHVIRPEVPVQLELTHDSGNGSLHFRYFSDVGQHAGGRILFGPST